mgnify:CR=1 FL=1
MENRRETWRNDLNPTDRGGPDGSFAVCAEDRIESRDIYALVIRHVEGLRGKGFAPAILMDGRTQNTGLVHHGTGEEAYDAAKKEGARLLEEQIEHLERAIAAHEAMVATRRSQTP